MVVIQKLISVNI
ncbi:hypothetical protein FWK35_00004935 [Aphis craccivora]|uniref:Uncharacterized protein n=1 Tax=Aphis craccivora TaxID=307492 RepID=A0A6G0ZED4_APHCR|nr:hypothetical protein FWK35_00004935 [Aphis craccivora]